MSDTGKPYTVRGVDETLLNLRRVYGLDLAALIWNSLGSAYERLFFARHHLELLQTATQPAVKQGLETWGFVDSLDREEDTEALFSQSMLQVKMHATDCIQHLHAIGDTAAFAIHYFVRVPEVKPMPERKITLPNVRVLLDANRMVPGAAAFSDLLKKLAEDENYIYLVDLNNYAKHRSIVKPAVSLSFDQEVSLEELKNLLIFSSVEMSKPPQALQNRGATPVHGQRPILPFIKTELARIWAIYGEIRQEIEKQARLAPSRAGRAADREA